MCDLAAMIREELTEHEFVFLNGGIAMQPDIKDATAAGEDLGDEPMYGYLGELSDVNQYQDLLEGMIDAVQSYGPFDGIMGFSEGGIVGATLLVEDARRPFANFKCGILFSAAPPLDPDDLRAGIVRCLDPAKDGVSIHVPTAHIYSHLEEEDGPAAGTGGSSSSISLVANVQSPLNKLWSEAGWTTPEQVHNSLARLCEDGQVFVHDHGHQVPGPKNDQAVRGALRAINRAIESASD